MLQFGMETKRINELVNYGASARMSDIKFLQTEIAEFLKSPQRKAMLDAEEYYDYKHLIRHRQRKVIKSGGVYEEDTNLPNNKVMDNQYAKMVDQKTNYLLSKPLTFKTDSEAYAERLGNIFNKKFLRTFKSMGTGAYNQGIGWLHPYYNEQGEFKFKYFPGYQILPYWKDDEHTELDFGVRCYEVEEYEGEEKKIVIHVEVYDTNGIHKFVFDDGTLIPEYSTYNFEVDVNNQSTPHNWERVPLIPFKANSRENPLLIKCKCLQDGINQIMSDFANGMEENASGNSIIVLKNYGGTDLGEFRKNLSQYRAVKVKTVDGADGGVETMEITVNAENYKAILELFKKALIENCRGYDVNELKSAGSPNEMTIKAVYSDIDLDANETECEFQASLEDLMWFVNQHLANTGQGNYENENVDIIFNRDIVVIEANTIDAIQKSVGILSTETLIAQHPYVDDPNKEMERLQKEKEESMAEMEQQMYGAAFGQQGAGGDVNAE